MSEDGLRTGGDHEGFENRPLSRWKDEVCSGAVIGKSGDGNDVLCTLGNRGWTEGREAEIMDAL